MCILPNISNQCANSCVLGGRGRGLKFVAFLDKFLKIFSLQVERESGEEYGHRLFR